jgi:hypothetical protein
MIFPLSITADDEGYEITAKELAVKLNMSVADVMAYLGEDLGEITGDFVLTITDKFLDIERDFVKVAARELNKPDLVDLWTKTKAKAEADLRQALDKAVNDNLTKTTYKSLNERYNASIVNALKPHEAIYEKAYERELIVFKPHNLSESDKVRITVNQGYKDSLGVMDRVILTGEEDVVKRLEGAITDVTTGNVSYSAGITEAMRDLAEEGITGHVYPSGRTISMSPYVRREIMNGMSTVCREINFERAGEWGSDLIQVTAHAGARPLCYPFQGRVYSLSGQHGKYMWLMDTSYGEPAGLFGINCRHWFFPFFEGLNTEYTDDEADPAAAVPGGPSNDEIYEATQVQRYNERMIRKWKLRQAGFEELDGGEAMADYAKAKVNGWQKRNRDFLKAMNSRKMDLRRDYLREKV